MVRGLGGADRMLIAQMDADGHAARPDDAATPPSSSASSTRCTPTDTARRLPARAALRDRRRCAALDRAEIVVVSDGALGEAADASGPVHLGDVKLSLRARSARASATSASRSSRCAATRSTRAATR